PGRLRRRTNCSRISPAERFRSTPLMPLAQNAHPMPQPTWVLTQAVRRPSSWISTHSTRRSAGRARESFVRAAAGFLGQSIGSGERRERGGQLVAQPFGQVGHLLEGFGAGGQEPAADLAGAHGGLAVLLQPGLQLVAGYVKNARAGSGN